MISFLTISLHSILDLSFSIYPAFGLMYGYHLNKNGKKQMDGI